MLKRLERLYARMLAVLRREKPKRRKELAPKKMTFVQFKDARGEEVCCGYVIEPQDGKGMDNWDDFMRRANKNLATAFRNVLANSMHQRLAKDLSDDEIFAAMNCMIALCGCRREDFFSGWQYEDAPRRAWKHKKEE